MLCGDHLLGVRRGWWSGRGVAELAAETLDFGDGLGFIFTPRQPREESSSTAQMRDRAEVSPGNRPMTLVRRRTSTNVLSRRFVVRMRLRCAEGNCRWVTSAGKSASMTAIAEG